MFLFIVSLNRVRVDETMYFVLLLNTLSTNSCLFDHDAYKKERAPAWFQTFWEPCVSCCNKTRIGRKGDGGKWVCFDSNIVRNDIVVSVGSNNDFSFEEELLHYVNTIQVYDHTSLPSKNQRIHFHKKKMTSTLLHSIIASHKNLSILKVDCEGCESSLFTHSILTKLFKMKTQILVEIHWNFLSQTSIANLWKRFASAGFGPFYKEPNIQFSDGSCIEYALSPYTH